MHLDDLGGLEVGGGHGGELHGEDSAHREVRGDQDGAPGGLGVLTHAGIGLFRPPGRAHNHIHARVEERVHVGLCDAGDREVNGHLRAVDTARADLIARIEDGNDLHVRGVGDRLNDGRAHAALGSCHCDANHCALLLTVVWLSSGYSHAAHDERG